MEAHDYGLAGSTAIINSKGGTLKSSITSSIAGLVAATGEWRVLIVDLDRQGDQATNLGLTEITDEGKQLFEALTTGAPLTPVATGRPGLDVVFGGDWLSDPPADGGRTLPHILLELQEASPGEWAYLLADTLGPISEDYDLILLDCPPHNAELQILALVAARHMVIPSRGDEKSRKGVSKLSKAVQIAHRFNPDLGLLGVVLAGVDISATQIRARARAKIESDLGTAARVFDQPIRIASGVEEACEARGLLPHELESQVEREPGYWAKVREALKKESKRAKADRGKHRRPPVVVSHAPTTSTRNLASDYAALTQEVLDALAAAEQEIEAQEDPA